MSQLDTFLTTAQQLFIQQRRELVEILINWETTNKYVILDSSRNEVGAIAERGGKLGTMLRRWIFRSHRPLEVDVFDRAGQVRLHLTRSFFFFFSDLDIKTPDGLSMGSVHRRFGIVYKRYDLRDSRGNVFATIKSPFWRLWTFPVFDLIGNQKATVAKRWGGALREVFTDADTYMVDFGTHPWPIPQRLVLFGAAISIDFDFFENNQGVGGMSELLGP